MEITWIGNIIEGIFWLFVGLLFLAPACRAGEMHRRFCLFGALVFIIFGLSDFYEAQTGAWWEPWWLILWNAVCNIGIAVIIIWYININGGWKNTVAKLNRPVFKKKLQEENVERQNKSEQG